MFCLPINGSGVFRLYCSVDKIERKQPSASRVEILVYTVQIFTRHCSNYASKTKADHLRQP